MKKTVTARWFCLACAVVMVWNCSFSPAMADDLDALNARRDQAIADANHAQGQVDSASRALSLANDRVDDARAKVVAAQRVLEEAQAEWQAAQAVEIEMARQLLEAEQALAAAQEKVAQGQAKIDAQKSAINAYARSIVQDNLPMVNVALLLDMDSTATLANRVQWTDTILTTNQVDLDHLRQIQADLVKAQEAAEAAKTQANQAKQAADEQVAAAESAQQAAIQAEAAVADALAEEEAALSVASQMLNNSQSGLTQAQSSVAGIDQSISAEKARLAEIARQEEAARQAEEDRQKQDEGGGTPPPEPPVTPPVSGGDLSPAQAQAYALSVMPNYGWDYGQFECLVWLWNRESNWRWWAENPYSGAYGIPQSLPASKMASVGADYRTNAVTQIIWGLNYIAQRYGSPCGAWGHSQAYGWY